ncbi:MAG: PaaI family thioesterase [Candidatus Rokuibacteriota bacterium]|nr:MAG: PaaI family thioesterase [Candidatus Rokubacteria bacterium]
MTGPRSPWPFAELLGMRAKSVGDGRARFELAVEPRHLNPDGTLHGGVAYSLADSAMGAALFAQLGPGEMCVTLEIKMQYLAVVTGGALAVEAAVASRTKRIGVTEARVFGDGDRLVALATGTFYIQSART